MTCTTGLTIAGMLAASVLTGPQAWAQADFTEAFENNGTVPSGQYGPANLISQGWIFRNQCNPVEGFAWYDGDNFGTAPFEGTGYLTTSGLATDYFGGDYSVWAILPSIDNQIAGDEFTVWVYGGGSYTYDTFFEVRYAPSGTGTGSGPDAVGDFTELLYSGELPLTGSGYQRVAVALPGPGRIAMRVRADYMMTFAGNGFNLAIDSLTVGARQGDPCGIPIPNPGETVTWTAPGGPYTVCQDLVIPAGGIVNVEPGTTITFGSGNTLRIEGEFNAHGTLADSIVFNGSTDYNTGLEVSLGGQVDISFADLNVRVNGFGENAVFILTDSTVGSGAVIEGVRDLTVFERCMFDGGTAGSFSTLGGGALRLTDSSFVNGAYAHVGGLMYVENVDIDGGQLKLSSESNAHPVFVDNVSVTNYTAGAGISLAGPNYLLGQNVVTQGNQYPLEFDSFSGAGLLEGSTLPSTGNQNNVVPAGELLLGAGRYWTDTGLPYIVDGFPANYGGSLIVGPGANLRFGPDAGAFLVTGAQLVMQGTPERPIVMESDLPFAPWWGLKWVDVFDAKANHAIFDGGQYMLQSDGGYLDLTNCTVRNAQTGTASVTGGIVRLFNSKIINNNIGMTTTSSGRIEARGEHSPNVFDNNAVAVDYLNTNTVPYVRFNWWGSTTGPSDVLNPSGTGDEVNGLHPAAYTPYLTSAPPQDDYPPVIDMMPVSFTMQAGDKTILRWSSSDDNGVAAHRVEFANHDFPNEFLPVAMLPGDARTFEFTAPIVNPNNLYPTPSAIRIVAIDTAGQESWDKSLLRIPYQEDWNVVDQNVVTPADSHPHDTIDVCWSPGGNATAYILLDGMGSADYNGGSNTGCLPIGAGLPYASTDTARVLIITSFGAGGRLHYSFSDYFSIRPDVRFGDAPPVVDVTAPVAGSQFIGGGVIPVRWTASDDEELRSFNVQASFDGGRTWHWMARDLPGTARSFDWNLPASTGIADVRVRVVAFDRRFQDSSDTTGAVSILAGDTCPADFNADGELNFFDVQAFLGAFSNLDQSADFTHDGLFDFFDVQEFLALFSAGCP